MPVEALSIDCPAKLNLTLAVGSARSDGYHPIASVMTALDFVDRLTIEPMPVSASAANVSSVFERGWADDAPRPHPIDWSIESDLLFKAHAAVQARVDRSLPIRATLHKRIPAESGLGGGSGNAAGMLAGLRWLFDLPISDEDLLAIAKPLGADVCFAVWALLGQPTAIVTGIGERIEPLAHRTALHGVLVFPDGGCPTSKVYRAFDERFDMNRSESDLAALADAWRREPTRPEPMNDLTQAAISICPPLARAMQQLSERQLFIHLTGSGSAVFTFCEDASKARATAEQIQSAGLSCRVFSGLKCDRILAKR